MKKILFFIILLMSKLLFSQIQIGLNIEGEAPQDEFGSSVSLSSDGNIIAVGAPNNKKNNINSGHARIYVNNNGAWEQIGLDIDGETAFESFGKSVSLSSDGGIIAIGAPNKNANGTRSGHARVYQNNNGTWIQIGDDFNGLAAGDNLGYSVSLSSDGNTIAIGSPKTNGSTGHVCIYKNNNNIWTQIGDNIDGAALDDKFGINVSLSSNGSIVAIAAYDNEKNNINSSHVRVYQNNNGTWEQVGSDINTKLAGDFTESRRNLSSLSLSSDGNIMAIGSFQNNSGFTDFNYVSIYRNNNETWEQIGSDINGEKIRDQFGRSISLSSDGNTVAIGGPMYTSSGKTHSGHVRIYKNMNDIWTQVGVDINGEAISNLFGSSVSLSSDGNTIAIGGPDNNGYDKHIGHVRVFNLSDGLPKNNLVKFKLYPNPVNNKLTIQLKEDLQFKKASIYNSIGKFILTTTNQTIDVKNLSKGVYFVTIDTSKGITTGKIIID